MEQMRWKKHLLEHNGTDAEINPGTEIYSEYGTEKVKYRRKSAVLVAYYLV